MNRNPFAAPAMIIDDYGHHPVEIRAVLSAARESAGKGRVVAVVQPHRYTRLRDLMDDFQTAFNEADEVFVTGTSVELRPVVSLDRPGKHSTWPVGPITTALREAFRASTRTHA